MLGEVGGPPQTPDVGSDCFPRSPRVPLGATCVGSGEATSHSLRAERGCALDGQAVCEGALRPARAETAGHAAPTLSCREAGQVCGHCGHKLLFCCEVPASEVLLGSCGWGHSGHRCGRQARLAAPPAPALASGLGGGGSPAAPRLRPVCQDPWLPRLCGEPSALRAPPQPPASPSTSD